MRTRHQITEHTAHTLQLEAELSLKVPAGSKNGQQLRICQASMPIRFINRVIRANQTS